MKFSRNLGEFDGVLLVVLLVSEEIPMFESRCEPNSEVLSLVVGS